MALPNVSPATARIAPQAAAAVRAAIRLAGGREVCFVCTMDAEGIVQTARVVARGDIQSVLALPGFARRGEMLLHNHPSGEFEPSGPDLEIAARMHDDGIGFAIIDNDARELYVVVEVPRAREIAPLDLRRSTVTSARADRSREASRATKTAKPARLRARDRQAVQRGRHRTARGGDRRRQVARLPRARAALGGGERRAHRRVDQHDQPAGAARRQGPSLVAGALDDQKVRFALLKGWRNYLCLLRLEQARASVARSSSPRSWTSWRRSRSGRSRRLTAR